MAKDSNAVWQDIDVDSLSADLRKAYEAYKTAQRAAAELRSMFEEKMNRAAGLPETHKLVFGYRFGKLSAAVVENEDKPKASPKGQASLSDFLKAQKAMGART